MLNTVKCLDSLVSQRILLNVWHDHIAQRILLKRMRVAIKLSMIHLWSRHVTRHDSLSKTILRGTLEGGRRNGWPRKCWMDIKKWTSVPRTAHSGFLQKRLEEDLC